MEKVREITEILKANNTPDIIFLSKKRVMFLWSGTGWQIKNYQK
jgi:hypothetical protein